MFDMYGIRQFTDANGVAWDVWEAHPRLAERRRARERRVLQRNDSADRRVKAVAAPLPLADAEGWLVFRSARDERRRTPIPAGWQLFTEPQLREVLSSARATAPFPRARRAAPPLNGPALH